jgi:hypothetical protein
VRALLDRSHPADLTPTVCGREDVGWWYRYLAEADDLFRAHLRVAIDGPQPERGDE